MVARTQKQPEIQTIRRADDVEIVRSYQRCNVRFPRRSGPALRGNVPRLSRTPGEPGASPAWPGADTEAVLREAGFEEPEIAALREAGAVA